MPITQAVTVFFKSSLFAGVHQPGDSYKIALYTAAAQLDAQTFDYTPVGEVVGAGYVAGGAVLAGRQSQLSGDTAYLTWADPSWPDSTIANARGALIYNASRENEALCVLDFGQNVSSQNGTFRVDLPAAGVNALLRIP